jgi:hypothetical protein
MTEASLSAAQVRDAIHKAFDAVVSPQRPDDMLLAPYRSSIDATEMAAEFLGRSWKEIPVKELFRHREMLPTMSAAAYRAYLPGYLVACVNEDPAASKYIGDLWEYTVLSLKAWPGQEPTSASRVTERLSLMNSEQREAIRLVLRFIAERSQRAEVQSLLNEW